MKKNILFKSLILAVVSTVGIASFGEITEADYNSLKEKVNALEQEKNKLKDIVDNLKSLISEDNAKKELIIGKTGEFNPYSYTLKNNILIGHGPFIADKDRFVNTIVIGGNNSLEKEISRVSDGIILGTSNKILKGDKDDAGGQGSPINNFVYGYKNILIGSYASTIGIENKVRNSSRKSYTSQDFSFVIGKKNNVFGSGYIIGDQNKVNTLRYYREEGYNPNITGAHLYVNGWHNIVGSSGENTKDNFRFVDTGVIVGNDNLTADAGNTIFGTMNKVVGGVENVLLGRANYAIRGMTDEEWLEKKYTDKEGVEKNLPYILPHDRILLYKTPEITYKGFLDIKSPGSNVTEEEFPKVMEAIKEDINSVEHPFKFYAGMIAVGDGNTVRGRYTTAVGSSSQALQEGALSVGRLNEAKSRYSTVLGNRNITEKDSIGSVVLGMMNYNTGSRSLNVGLWNNNLYNSKNGKFIKNKSGEYSIALGISNKTEGENSLSVGYKNTSPTELSNAIGSYNNAAGVKSVAVGYYNRSLGSYSQAIGDINLTGERATAIGYWNNAITRNSVAIGQENNVSGYAGVAFGSQNNKNTQNLIKALGIENGNTGDFSTIFGISNISIGEYTQAFGNDNFSLGRKALAIGNSAKSVGYETIAIGTNSTVGPDEITKDKLLDLKRAVAIGSETSVAIDDAIALGSYSNATREKGEYGYNVLIGEVIKNDAEFLKLNNKEDESKNLTAYRTALEEAKNAYEDKKIEFENKSIEINTRKWDREGLSEDQKQAELQKLQVEYGNIEAELVEKKKVYDDAQKKVFTVVGAWQSQLGALSIGDEETGRTRQITGVAAGTKDTDAVNVAQLKMLTNIPAVFYTSDNKGVENNKYEEPTLIDFNKLKFEFGYGLKAKKVVENDNEKLLITIDRDLINGGSSSTTPGKTPTIEINNEGYWVINGQVTDKQSKGKDGKDGNSGSANINLNAGDNISITKENDETKIALKKEINVESIKGLIDLDENSDGSSAANKNYVDSKFNSIKNNVDKAVGGVANAIAMANLTQISYKDGYRKQISAAYGYYGGQSAISVGFSGISENGKLIYKLSGSLNNQGNIGLGLGIGYQFDKEKLSTYDNSIIEELKIELKKSNLDNKHSQEEIKKLKNELDEFRNIINTIVNKSQNKLYTIINYNEGAYILTKLQEDKLKEIVKELNENYRGRTIDITGFTDIGFSMKYNLELGLNRAKEIVEKLYDFGLDNSIIIGKVSSFGYTNIVSTNSTSKGKKENRRVEILVK